MNAVDNALFILMAEALLGMITLAAAIFFIKYKKSSREMREIDTFISQLETDSEIRYQPLEKFLSETCKLDRATINKALSDISETERALLQAIIKLFLQREMSVLQSLDQHIGDLSNSYCELLTKLASRTPETAVSDKSGLELINQQLVRQLDTAMQTIDEITAEYTRVFSGNQTELELDNSRKKMLQTFQETQQALLHATKP